MTRAAPHAVCQTSDIPPGEGRAVTVAGRRIAVFNAATGWYALDAACPHRGGPLADGLVSDACVVCPLHERRFDLRTGAALGPGEGVTAHTVEVRGDRVEVTLATEAAAIAAQAATAAHASERTAAPLAWLGGRSGGPLGELIDLAEGIGG